MNAKTNSMSNTSGRFKWGKKKTTVVTNKQDLPDCCIAMLFNAHLCFKVWRQQGTQHSFLSSAKVTIAFIF